MLCPGTMRQFFWVIVSTKMSNDKIQMADGDRLNIKSVEYLHLTFGLSHWDLNADETAARGLIIKPLTAPYSMGRS